MRWYTRDWQQGDETQGDPVEAYVAYLEGVASQLPDSVLAFAQSRVRHLAVDDARVDLAELDAEAELVRLRLINGDEPTGYGTLDLRFLDAELTHPGIDEAAMILRDPKTEFLVHELELLDDRRLEVRFLLWPRGELVIRCRDVRTEWHPADRSARLNPRHDVLGFEP